MDAYCASVPVVSGCACLGISPLCPFADNLQRGRHCVVPDGATIGAVPGVYGTDGTVVPYTRVQMRDHAHEFGHDLGLVRDAEDGLHVMSGTDDIALYSDRGYSVPDRIADGDRAPGTGVSERAAQASCAASWVRLPG